MTTASVKLCTALALSCWISPICACATSRPPASYGGTSIAAFADSRSYEPELHADPALLTNTVKILPWKRTLRELFVDQAGPEDHSAVEAANLDAAFGQWCQANRGRADQIDGTARAFRTAADEYWYERLEARNKKINRDVSSRACVGADGAVLGGYVNLANADIAFYDRGAAAALVDKFRGPAQDRARRDSAAALAELERNEEERRSSEERRRRRDAHPDLEPRRRVAALEVARLVKQYGVFHRIEYVDSCVIRGGKIDAAAGEVYLGAFDRQMAENVSWLDVPIVGIVFHLYFTEGPGKGGVELGIKDKDVAARIIRQLEEIGDSCR